MIPPCGGCCGAHRSSPTNGKGATPRSGTFAADQARPTGRARHFAAARLPLPDGGCCGAHRSSPTNGKDATLRSGTFAAAGCNYEFNAGSLIDFFFSMRKIALSNVFCKNFAKKFFTFFCNGACNIPYREYIERATRFSVCDLCRQLYIVVSVKVA